MGMDSQVPCFCERSFPSLSNVWLHGIPSKGMAERRQLTHSDWTWSPEAAPGQVEEAWSLLFLAQHESDRHCLVAEQYSEQI